MQMQRRFAVRAPADAVWAFLTDPYRVAECLPGAAITERVDERTYRGTITVKVGPVATSYRGEVRFQRLDPGERVAEIAASGQDVRGRGGAELRLSSRVASTPAGEAEVEVVQDLEVTGMLAQLGRGMLEDVGDQLFAAFTAELRARLEATAAGTSVPSVPAAPVQLATLSTTLAGRALARAARRPAVWVVVLGLAFLLWWVWIR
jgi:carbon monoxide dehydrogenase subunit G